MDSKKLERKPYRLLNPLGNTSRYEYASIIAESLFGINKYSLEVPANKGGVPLYYYMDNIYVDANDSHTLVIGATGSKKTRLVVLPTCLILAKAQESVIVTDPKAEIYNRTAETFQKLGYKIEVLNFRDPSVGNCWNPFSIPCRFYKEDKKDKAYEFLNDIGTNLFLSQIKQDDPFWDNSAADLFFGLASLAMRLSDESHEMNIRDIIELRHKLFLEGHRVDNELLKIANEDLVTSQSLLGVVTAPNDTQKSILTVFDQKMRIFSLQDNLLSMLSTTTLSMDTIGTQKTIVYLIMPDEKTTLHPLISLFIKQSYEYLIFLAQNKNQKEDGNLEEEQTVEHDSIHEGGFKIRINYLLDEFSALPKIGDFPAMITAARSRNIRFNLIIQSSNQLKSRYKEEASTIKGNCNNWIFLYSKEVEILEEISKLCGLDDKSMPMISIFALQHLDKEKGEAIVLSNRLFPVLSNLEDIKFFDDEKYTVLPFEKRDKPKEDKPYVIWEGKNQINEKRNGGVPVNSPFRTENDAFILRQERDRLKNELKEKSRKLELITPDKGTVVLGIRDAVYLLVCVCSLQYVPILSRFINWPKEFELFVFVTVCASCILLLTPSIRSIITTKDNRQMLFGGLVINALCLILSFFFVPTRSFSDNIIIIAVNCSCVCFRILNVLTFSKMSLNHILGKNGNELSGPLKTNAILDAVGGVLIVIASLCIVLYHPSITVPYRIVFVLFLIMIVSTIIIRVCGMWKDRFTTEKYILLWAVTENGILFIYIVAIILIMLRYIYK